MPDQPRRIKRLIPAGFVDMDVPSHERRYMALAPVLAGGRKYAAGDVIPAGALSPTPGSAGGAGILLRHNKIVQLITPNGEVA